MPAPTPQQQAAIAAHGDVLVIAGAGTGKTSTLVARILDRILVPAPQTSLDRLLVVTFTEAAALEMRHRLRMALEDRRLAAPADPWLSEQLALLDVAQVSTLHAFCLRLIREHFHQLGLDPRFSVQDPMQDSVLRRRVLTEVLREHYRGDLPTSEIVQPFLERFAADGDQVVRTLVTQVHDYARSLPEPDAWLAEQRRLHESDSPDAWCDALRSAVPRWARDWLNHLRSLSAREPRNFAARECGAALEKLSAIDRHSCALISEISAVLAEVAVAGDRSRFPRGKIGAWRQPIRELFEEAEELRFLIVSEGPDGPDLMLEDWAVVRHDVLALLTLAGEFLLAFNSARRSAGVVDFADLEQLALQLLWDPRSRAPTDLACHLQQQTDLVMVDEYQDINGAQDRIITCLSRSGPAANRFFVGDVKQSIYRFRRADPRIFQQYALQWRHPSIRAVVLPLAENFRSHERILHFVNALFAQLMRVDVGGVAYDAEAHLLFGAPDERDTLRKDPEGRVELLLQLTDAPSEENPDTEGTDTIDDDLDAEEAQAAMVAARLRELHESRVSVWDAGAGTHRSTTWRDMAVLHPTPRPVAQRWARQFLKAGIPFETRRGGFFDGSEVADLINLVRLLDNPRQDLPLLAVLRSPLVNLSADELVMIRVARRDATLWEALNTFLATAPGAPVCTRDTDEDLQALGNSTRAKAAWFRQHFDRWRRVARDGSLAWCLETVLADSSYEAGIRAAPLAVARMANIRKLLALAHDFDQFHRHGLFRFLQFLDSQAQADYDAESALATPTDSVRLVSIHQSKGLEFPVVVVAGLGRPFHEKDLHAEWIIDEELGVCPPVALPGNPDTHPSLARWLARNAQRREFIGEQIRLFYVACTRAAERLLLVGGVSRSALETWSETEAPLTSRALVEARTPLSWLGPLMAKLTGRGDWFQSVQGCGQLIDWHVAAKAPPPPSQAVATSDEILIAPDTMQALHARVAWRYPRSHATTEPAKVAVTRLTRQWRSDPEAASARWIGKHRGAISPATSPDPIERGMAHHRVLELLDLKRTSSLADLTSEIRRLEQSGWIGALHSRLLDIEGLWTFWNSDLGSELRARQQFIQREIPFTARLRPTEAAAIRGTAPEPTQGEDDFHVIQGVVDLAVISPDEIWIIDFKTDDLRSDEIETRSQEYAPQVRLYAHALHGIYARPVTQCWLYFVAPRRLVRMNTAVSTPSLVSRANVVERGS
jgi:ATP-dependent helicase/nuclease subunit A